MEPMTPLLQPDFIKISWAQFFGLSAAILSVAAIISLGITYIVMRWIIK